MSNDIPLHHRKGVRQFVKFCIVGSSSYIVNMASLALLYYVLPMTYLAAYMGAFLISVVNGFVWNRIWTFKESRSADPRDQYIKFLAVNIVGLTISTVVSILILHQILQYQQHVDIPLSSLLHDVIYNQKGKFPKMATFSAAFGAAMIVVFWNFFANRIWTFKKKS